MRTVPNTIRRAGVFYFRRAIPSELRGLLSRVELCCSLRTTDVGSASSLSRCLYLRSEELFARVKSSPMLTDTQLASMVQDFYALVLKQDNQLRLDSRGPIDEPTRQARIAHYADVAEQSRRDLATNNFASADLIAALMIQKHGLAGQIEIADVRLVQQAMLRAGCDLADAVRARYQGDFNHEPRDKLLTAALGEIAPVVIGPASPQHEPEQPAPAAGRPFAAVAEEFRATQVRRKVWEQQTALQARKTYQLFAELSGDRPLSGYLKDDAVRFKSMLLELPANYSKAPQYRGMTAEAIVAGAMAREESRLSSRTVKRHLTALSALWDSAIESGELSLNIFRGFKFTGAKRAQDQRAMWTSEDLEKLFATPVWSGCQSAERRSKPGSLVIRDEKYWLPLIALYSGMRQEEICQLHVADVREADAIWVFDINAAPPRQLKNLNAVRIVPVHRELIRLGLVEYVKAQQKAARMMVFHNLNAGGADQRLGHNFTKWFTRYRRDVGVYEPGRDFHSFRHSATTFLQRAKIPMALIDALTGHSTPGETARYSKGYDVADLKAAIDSLDPKLVPPASVA